MLSLQSDPRQYNLNLQQLQQQQQQQQQNVARVPYGVDHHREDSSLALSSSSNTKQELSREGLGFSFCKFNFVKIFHGTFFWLNKLVVL